MTKVFMTCTGSTRENPFVCRDYERLLAFAERDTHKNHALVEHPEDADVVAFVGSACANFADVTESDVYRKFHQKSVLYFTGDRAIPILPGVYTCLDRHWLRMRPAALAGFYLRVSENESLDIEEDIRSAEYLFSFVGNAKNHSIRAAICRLKHARALLRDSSFHGPQQDDGATGRNRERGLFYREVMARSTFVLCPRGYGVSTWRLFETMRAGRVPVVISDAWVRPPGPKWDAFCLFVSEAQVNELPDLLEQEEERAPEMGAIARKEWERWYSEESVFNTVIEHLALAHRRRQDESRMARLLTCGQYLEPYFLRHWVLSPLKRRAKGLFAKNPRAV